MLEVEPAGYCDRMAIVSDQNVLQTDKLASSISRKPSEIEQRLLVNVNRQSSTAYGLSWSTGIA